MPIIVAGLLLSCTQQEEVKSPIEGTWQLLEGKVTTADTMFTYPGSTNAKHWKIITESHFATIYQDTTSNEIFSTGFNGGTYTYIDGVYTEYFTHSKYSSQIGSSLSFKAKIEGDRLHISPCNEDGTENEFGNIEKYKRLD